MYWYPGNNSIKLDDEDDTPTWPTWGKVEITQRQEIIFYSVCWILEFSINGKPFILSKKHDDKCSDAYIRRWARELIRRYKVDLERLTVNTIKEYERFGGDSSDL